MKGTPDMPMCGFSKGVVQILELHGNLTASCQHPSYHLGVELEKLTTVNVLEDDSVRNGIKEYSYVLIDGLRVSVS